MASVFFTFTRTSTVKIIGMWIVSSKRQITLPINQCKLLGIQPGDEVEIFAAHRMLTIVADTAERPVPLLEIGSGENHVGYHIVAHLALHTWFANRQRPVPSFLLLDQLSQAHFSPDALPRDGVTQEKIDSDRKAVKGLFGLIFDVVESLQGKFQVIIKDHPDFIDDVRFQTALRERWRDGLKLVPEDWPKSDTRA
jgi:bifunctional DNA-binding transcriptional regulator/antitoxin component of YhaV-PrlF toxin-antitoxin module